VQDERAVAAGYGADAEGTRGRLQLVVERIGSIGGDELVATTDGRGGPCDGDSGGPLLARREDGAFGALGVLRGVCLRF